MRTCVMDEHVVSFGKGCQPLVVSRVSGEDDASAAGTVVEAVAARVNGVEGPSTWTEISPMLTVSPGVTQCTSYSGIVGGRRSTCSMAVAASHAAAMSRGP